MMIPSKTLTTLNSICRLNRVILAQKLSFIDILTNEKTNNQLSKAEALYTKICPLVQSSVGQHIRHSMDHIELAALIAQQINHHSLSNSTKTLMMSELHYDLRVRGGTVETDINESRKRIESVMNVFDELQIDDEQQEIQNIPINAYFMLSSSPKEGESQFQSTIGRELGFVAHHAIHHMAMVKVIALHSIGFTENELPTDFGRAPSTVQHDLSSNNEK